VLPVHSNSLSLSAIVAAASVAAASVVGDPRTSNPNAGAPKTCKNCKKDHDASEPWVMGKTSCAKSILMKSKANEKQRAKLIVVEDAQVSTSKKRRKRRHAANAVGVPSPANNNRFLDEPSANTFIEGSVYASGHSLHASHGYVGTATDGSGPFWTKSWRCACCSKPKVMVPIVCAPAGSSSALSEIARFLSETQVDKAREADGKSRVQLLPGTVYHRKSQALQCPFIVSLRANRDGTFTVTQTEHNAACVTLAAASDIRQVCAPEVKSWVLGMFAAGKDVAEVWDLLEMDQVDYPALLQPPPCGPADNSLSSRWRPNKATLKSLYAEYSRNKRLDPQEAEAVRLLHQRLLNDPDYHVLFYQEQSCACGCKADGKLANGTAPNKVSTNYCAGGPGCVPFVLSFCERWQVEFARASLKASLKASSVNWSPCSKTCITPPPK
jgi:hypothetical protein